MRDDAPNEFVAALINAPEYVNPAIALAARAWQAEASGDTEFIERVARSGELERAVEEGSKEGAGVLNLLKRIGHSVPRSSKSVPVGF